MAGLGLISDTHNSVANIQIAMRFFERLEVDRIIHCGDVTDPTTIEYFRGIPFSLVLGNCDRDVEGLRRAVHEIGGTVFEIDGYLRWRDYDVFFTHGDRKSLLKTNLESGVWDVVCSGHTHEFAAEQNGRTRYFNPGACSLGSFCIIDENLSIQHYHCESDSDDDEE